MTSRVTFSPENSPTPRATIAMIGKISSKLWRISRRVVFPIEEPMLPPFLSAVVHHHSICSTGHDVVH